MDSHDIASDNKITASSLKNEMVILCNECDVKAEPVYIPTITGVTGQLNKPYETPDIKKILDKI